MRKGCHAAATLRGNRTVELMALLAGAFAAIGQASAETNPERSSRIAQLILRGPQPRLR